MSEGTWEKLSQVAVKGAQYDSRERQPHPKCLKGTRVDLLNVIYGLLDKQEKNQIVWLHGTAGVGKSAVAFTIAERMRDLKVTEGSKEKRLAGTFFFSRKHTKRCTTGYFFATLAYQLGSNFPSIRSDVNKAIIENPALLDHDTSLRDQMEALFLRPLRNLQLRLRECPPLTFVIDALDECASESLDENTSQSELAYLISLLGEALCGPNLPVTHILLTSRSEEHIRKAMQTEEMRTLVCEIPVRTSGEGVAATISLDGADVDNDIHIFLQHSFTELQSRHPDFPQPSTDQLARLASRAGRRFIVASTMMKFIDDQHNDPRDRLELMLELTSELLPGTEVYKLYDQILSTCTEPTLAYLHLSVVCALADPLPMSQISKLLGPSQGRDVERVLVQLRSVIEIPTDSSCPVHISHSSVRDYVSHRSNCSIRQDITSPHSLLALSSLHLMVHDIPKSTALLVELLALNRQSQAMEPHDPQSLKHSLTFIIHRPEPLQVLIALLWLRGRRDPELQLWLETMDGHAWLRTEEAKDWLQTQGSRDWLNTPGGRGWLETMDGLAWLQDEGAIDWLQTQGSRDWLDTLGGRVWLVTTNGLAWLQTEGAIGWLWAQGGRDWLNTPGGQAWLDTPGGQAWLETMEGLAWLQIEGAICDWLQTLGGRDWLNALGGRAWLQTEGGEFWLQMNGEDWLQSPDGRDWLQTWGDQDWLQTRGGQDWLQTWVGGKWLESRAGEDWLESWGGRDWLQTCAGKDWLQTESGKDWLQSRDWWEWLQALDWPEPHMLEPSPPLEPFIPPRYSPFVPFMSQPFPPLERFIPPFDSPFVPFMPQSSPPLVSSMSSSFPPLARYSLFYSPGTFFAPSSLLPPFGSYPPISPQSYPWPPPLPYSPRVWLQIPGRYGRGWLETQSGQDWLQTQGGQDWLQTMCGQDWLGSADAKDWLQTQGGRGWLKTTCGRGWLQTLNGEYWLQTTRGREWLQTPGGREWLQTLDGVNWLQTASGPKWLQTTGGREWLRTSGGREWLQILEGQGWLQTLDGVNWLQTADGREWLGILERQGWLQTLDGVHWLQTACGREWLQTSHGQAWRSIDEFLSTLDATREYIIVPELLSQPTFQAIQQFKSLPDFLMFPAFLALRQQDHSTSALAEHHFPPEVEIIHAMKAFAKFANDAREQSRSSSDALSYACQNWAIHLSRAPKAWDERLTHMFKTFWNHNLLSWLERQWCLKDLRSCLAILCEGQKLAKEFLPQVPG